MAQEYHQIAIADPKPFVKWVGGKRQLMQELENNFPKQFGTYHEPFLGGGAVMFNLLSKEPKLSCNVSDFNSDLIGQVSLINFMFECVCFTENVF